MSAPLYIVDFHAHLMTLSGVERICPLEQKSAFFRYAVPILEPIAQLTAPFHDRFLRDVSMHHRDSLSRSVYAQFGQLFLMEALRLFKTHGLKRLVESMDKLRIDHAVIYSLEPLTRTREIVELVGSYPGRFSVFGSVACAEPDAAAYLEPFMQSGSIRGVKIHPMVGGYSVTGLYDETKEYVALAQDYNLPVAIHTGNIPTSSLKELNSCASLADLEMLVRAFPRCRFILNHIGWESWREVLAIAREHPNVMVETSWQPAAVIRRATDRLGAERVLFGSDYPMFQEWQALREVKEALSPAEYELVVSKNAVSLLGLEPGVHNMTRSAAEAAGERRI